MAIQLQPVAHSVATEMKSRELLVKIVYLFILLMPEVNWSGADAAWRCEH